MITTTSYLKTDANLIAIDRVTDKIIDRKDKRKRIRQDFFSFKTVTRVTPSSGKSLSITLVRKMAIGLMDYFLRDELFRETVLRENQAHAVKIFYAPARLVEPDKHFLRFAADDL